MPNEYGVWTRDHRPSVQTGWRVDSEAKEIFRGVDRLDAALEDAGIDADNPADGQLADWQSPRFSHNTAGTAWMAEWIDNTDSANMIKRIKFGTSKVLATPASITDGQGVQLFTSLSSPPI